MSKGVIMLFSSKKTEMVGASEALAGRDARPFAVPARHFVLDTPLEPPYPDGLEVAYFALGCFWGAERRFWQVDGVFSTASGYQGGFTPNPTYEEVCTAKTGHAEVVKVVFDPAKVS
ncbi:MAG TPA: peptide-methionine (S)-S-oxide reductase, partial [Mycobacteriales bacterium]|nr:peptide-methionine (S)-S-oxide reductase [Mycobacteriales bacterium]